MHCIVDPPTDIIRAGASGKPGSAGERNIGYDIRNYMSWYRRSETVISGMIFRTQISVKHLYHSSELRYPYILISASPISEVLWYRYILISRTTISGSLGYHDHPISGILRYHSTRYHVIRYPEYSDIGGTAISELEKSAPISDLISGYTDIGSRAPISEFGKNPDETEKP